MFVIATTNNRYYYYGYYFLLSIIIDIRYCLLCPEAVVAGGADGAELSLLSLLVVVV